MATRIFVGDATAVAQVDTVQITSGDATTTYTLTINGKTVSLVGQAAVGDIADDLADNWNASTIPEFAEVTAVSDTVDTITLTAGDEGKPFTAASSVAGGGGTIGAVTSVTANDGPEVWSGANFKTDAFPGVRGTIPSGGDVVILEDHSGDILYGLDQSGAGAITSLTIRASFTGKIGLPQSNESGGTAYDEYRPRFLDMPVGIVDIGNGSGRGSSKIRLSLVQSVSLFVVHAMSASSDSAGALELDGDNNTITEMTVFSGTVDVARDDGTGGADITTLVVDTGATVFVDENCILTTVNMEGGTLTSEVAITTLTIHQGSVTHEAGNITTANVLGGTLLFANPADLTVTTVAMGTGGVINTDQSSATVTFTNISMAPGQLIEDPDRRITLSNPATNPANAALDELGLNIGRGFTLLWA